MYECVSTCLGISLFTLFATYDGVYCSLVVVVVVFIYSFVVVITNHPQIHKELVV